MNSKRTFLLLSFFLSAVLLAASGTGDSAERNDGERTVSYYGTESVTIPFEITRIASGWNAQNSIIAMLGYGDKIVATTDIIRKNEVFRKFIPSIVNAELCFTGKNVNKEGIIKAAPEVLFIYDSSRGDKFNILEEFGIRVVQLKSNSLRNIIDRTVITGQILGFDAETRASQYVDYVDNNIRRVTERLSDLKDTDKVKVYHALGSLYNTSGTGLVQDWMDLGGAQNVAEGLNTGKVNLEQIVEWDPEVIISMRASTIQEIENDERFGVVKAVKAGRLFVNPQGMFWWCRETSEEALQFLWLATVLYPEQLSDIDMVEETRYFYKTFYGYDLTADEAKSFLYPE